jgi:methyl-accepting chemotaxis protein
MADIGTLLMKVNADTNGFEKGMKKSSKMVDGLKTATVAASTALVAGTVALGGMAKKATENADRIDKMSQKMGLSRKGFQELEFVASQSGTSVESLSMGMKTLAMKAVEAAEGTGIGAEAFDKLGISATDSSGKIKDQETLLNEVVTSLQNMEDGTEKAALASDLLGKSGQELMPLLNGTSGSMEDMAQQANDLGLIIGDKTIDAGVKLTDTMDQIKRSLGAVTTKIGGSVLPIIQKMLDTVMRNMPKIQKVMKKTFDGVKKALSVFTKIVKKTVIPIIKKVVDTAKNNMPALKSAFIEAFTKAKDVVMALWEFFKVNLLPIFYNLFTWVKKNMPEIKTFIVDAFKGALNIFDSVWAFVKDYILPIIAELYKLVSDLLPKIWTFFKDALDPILDLATTLWEFFKDKLLPIIQSIFDKVKDVIPKLVPIFEVAFEAITATIGVVVEILKAFVSWIDKALEAAEKLSKLKEESKERAERTAEKGFQLESGERISSTTLEGTIGDWVRNKIANPISGQKANGGYVKGGSSYLVGEKGPEMFTPASNGNISNGKGDIQLIVTGNTIMNERDANRVGEMLVRKLRLSGVKA